MGLLDSLDDPRQVGLLSLGLGLLNSRGSFGQGIGQAGQQSLLAMQEAKQRQQMNAARQQQQQMQGLQMQQAQQQLAEMQRQAAEREKLRSLAAQFARSPQQQAMANGAGPTVENAAAIPNTSPGFDFEGYAGALAGIDPMASLNMRAALKKDAPKRVVVGEGASLVDEATGKPLYTTPKAQDLPSAVREYQFAQSQGFPGTFQEFVLAQKKASASNTNVNVSMDKGFGEAFAKDAAASLSTSRDKAKGAADSLRTVSRIESALNSGNVITGPVAKPQLVLSQVADAMGIGGKDNAERLANTRNLMQGAASLAVDGAQALAGQGQITDKERELVNRMAGGNIDSMTVPEIKATVQTLRKINTLRIQSHQSALKNVGPQFAPYVPFYQVEVPEAPASVDDLLKKYGAK